MTIKTTQIRGKWDELLVKKKLERKILSERDFIMIFRNKILQKSQFLLGSQYNPEPPPSLCVSQKLSSYTRKIQSFTTIKKILLHERLLKLCKNTNHRNGRPLDLDWRGFEAT